MDDTFVYGHRFFLDNLVCLASYFMLKRFVESAEQKLRSETAESVIVGFDFTGKIREIEAVVSRMAFPGATKVE